MMKWTPPIVLIGFMGAGKSFMARELSQYLGCELVDTDDWIETNYKQSIAHIFEEEGEAVFRNYESIAMKTILEQKTNKVVATGGGLPCFNNNMDWLLSNSYVIYLKASPTLLLKRLEGEREKRPLLKNKTRAETLSFIQDKLIEREVFYAKAHRIFYWTGDNEKDLSLFLSMIKNEKSD